MNKILVFLAGVLSSVAIVGGLAAWFLIFSPEAAKQNPAPIPAPVVGKPVASPVPVTTANNAAPAPAPVTATQRPVTNFPTQADQDGQGSSAAVLLEGRISLPAPLKKMLAQYPKATLSIRFQANTSGPSAQGNLVDPVELANLLFPHTYSLQMSGAWVAPLSKFQNFPLVMRAVICLDKKEAGPCRPNHFPTIEGILRFRAQIPADAKGTLRIAVPNLIMTRVQRKPDAAACAAARGQLSGTLISSPAFTKAGHKRVLLVGSPYHDRRPPAPFAGPPGVESLVKVTAADLANISNHGIAYTPVAVSGAETKFSLTIPTNFRDELYRLYYVPCREGEADNACLLRAFPLSMLHAPGQKRSGAQNAVVVVAKNFEAPYCGMKEPFFYLHSWDHSVIQATEQTMHLANPPELIEGSFY